jgi:hypothetical protein
VSWSAPHCPPGPFWYHEHVVQGSSVWEHVVGTWLFSVLWNGVVGVFVYHLYIRVWIDSRRLRRNVERALAEIRRSAGAAAMSSGHASSAQAQGGGSPVL